MLSAADGVPADRLGRSLALSGDALLAGAPERDETGTSSGAAYVRVRSGTSWTRQQKPLPSDLAGSGSNLVGVTFGP